MEYIKLLRSVTHQCIVLKDHAGEKVYIDLAPIADELESLGQQLTAARDELAAEKAERERVEADARHFESLYRTAKVEFNFKDSEVDRLQEEIEALKVSNSIDAAGNEQFQKAFERAEQAEAQCVVMRGVLEKAHNAFDNLIDYEILPSAGYDEDASKLSEECYYASKQDAGTALLAELQRYRSLSASSSAQRGTAGEGDAP